jgi:ABC-type transport system involved in cytochrome c biogenesis permease subunit
MGLDFVTRISVTCFAASYAVTLVAELVRLAWPVRPIRWLATLGLAAGLLAHSLFLGARGVELGRLPISTRFESLIAIAWLVALIHLYVLLRERRVAAGLFLLPVVLGLIATAVTMTDPAVADAAQARSLLATAHGVLLLVATAGAVLAAIAAAMYLIKRAQLKSGGAPESFRLPSLESLERTNAIAVRVTFPILTGGLGVGFMLGLLHVTDPKVIVSLIGWGTFLALEIALHQPENRGRRIAVLTLIAAAAVLASVLADPILGTAHQAPAVAEARR